MISLGIVLVVIGFVATIPRLWAPGSSSSSSAPYSASAATPATRSVAAGTGTDPWAASTTPAGGRGMRWSPGSVTTGR